MTKWQSDSDPLLIRATNCLQASTATNGVATLYKTPPSQHTLSLVLLGGFRHTGLVATQEKSSFCKEVFSLLGSEANRIFDYSPFGYYEI